MLKQRVITAIILTLAFLGALFGLPAQYFSVFIGLVLLLGAWEWAGLANCSARLGRLTYVAAMALVLMFIGFVCGAADAAAGLKLPLVKTLLLIAGAWWALALLLVQSYPSSAIIWGHPLIRLAMGVLVLAPTWLALVLVRHAPAGAWLVLMIAAVVATADIGGYFAGRSLGRHKLAQAVSPGKTLEGFMGGLLANVLLALGIAWFTNSQWWLLLAIVIPTSLASVLGDLLESMLKRHAGVKDSGVILPGHGGILDRVDGLTAAAPVFALALLASGWVLEF